MPPSYNVPSIHVPTGEENRSQMLQDPHQTPPNPQPMPPAPFAAPPGPYLHPPVHYLAPPGPIHPVYHNPVPPPYPPIPPPQAPYAPNPHYAPPPQPGHPQNSWALGYHFYGLPPPPLHAAYAPTHNPPNDDNARHGIPAVPPIPQPRGTHVPDGILAPTNHRGQRSCLRATSSTLTVRPNPVVGPGVIAIPCRLHRLNDEIKLFSIESSLIWDDFIVITSGYLGTRVGETHLTVRHSRMRTADRIRVTDNNEWRQFITELTGWAHSAHSRAVEIDIYLVREVGEVEPEEVEPVRRGGKKGKKRSQSEDIPPGSDAEKNRLTAHWFALLKSKHACEFHSRGSGRVYCYVRDAAAGPDLHQRLDLELISFWSNQITDQSLGFSTEHHPPNILALDVPRKRTKTASPSKTQEINLNITHSVAPHALFATPGSLAGSSSGPSQATQLQIASSSNPVTSNTSTIASASTEFLSTTSSIYPPVCYALELVNRNYEIELFHCIVALEDAGLDFVNQVEEAGLARLIDDFGVDEEYAPGIVEYCSFLADQAREEASYGF